ncbi:MAG: hypothetical protein NTV03_03310, partial [Candidatus Nomurabacteria bacterium]|nr:hypothetical protein [Candidatus Nomurabacteria bacterium]
RDLKLKEIEFDEELNNSKKEYEKLCNMPSYLSDKESFLDKKEKSEIKLKKIITEIDYLSKISGKEHPFKLFTKQTFVQTIKSRFKNYFKRKK